LCTFKQVRGQKEVVLDPEDEAIYSPEISVVFNGLHGIMSHLLNHGFLLGLFFDPEDRGDMFLRNVG
jgi:hypothetical protein